MQNLIPNTCDCIIEVDNRTLVYSKTIRTCKSHSSFVGSELLDKVLTHNKLFSRYYFSIGILQPGQIPSDEQMRVLDRVILQEKQNSKDGVTLRNTNDGITEQLNQLK